MIGIMKKILLLGVCVVASLLQQCYTQAQAIEVLSQPAVAPTAVASYPAKTINQASPSGKQMVIHVQIAEISLSKMRRLEVDLALQEGQKIRQLTGSDFLKGTNIPVELIDALQKKKIARILTASSIATYHNHSATLRIGTNISFSAKQKDRQSANTDFIFIGTHLDVVPKMLDDQNVLLNIQLDWSELAEALTNRTGAPHVRRIAMNTAIEAKLGEATLISRSFQTARQGDGNEKFALILTVTPELVERHRIGKRAIKQQSR